MMLFLVMGQLLTLDMGLTLYLTVALAGFLLAQTGQRPAELGWMLLAWVATALGVLSKGLVAAAIPAAVLVALQCVGTRFLAVAPAARGVGAAAVSRDNRSLALACGTPAGRFCAVLLRARAPGALLDPERRIARSRGGSSAWCCCSAAPPGRCRYCA